MAGAAKAAEPRILILKPRIAATAALATRDRDKGTLPLRGSAYSPQIRKCFDSFRPWRW
jgi:hypothetical protein